jgi:hypothetical protein
MGSSNPFLRKYQTNQIVESIQEVGLRPIDFDLVNEDIEARIRHKWSESCFFIGGTVGHYVARYVVGDGPDWPFEAYSWQALIPRIRAWLAEVKVDVETPDLWAELQREASLLGVNSDYISGNTPFTPQEQKLIAERLQEFAKNARLKLSLSEAQTRAVDAKLDYLVEAAGRHGRIDWRNIFLGVFFTFLLSAAIPEDSAHAILLEFLRGIGHFFGFPQLSSG